MQESLTLPSTANLVSGENPILIGYMSRSSSIVVNWTISFIEQGDFDLDVVVSGHRMDMDAYLERVGYYYGYQVIPEFSGPLQLCIIFLILTSAVILVLKYSARNPEKPDRSFVQTSKQ